jgi:type IV pilus assembly protein PilE
LAADQQLPQSEELTTMNKRRYSTGFTLIELMVVMTIIGILAAVAWPAYKDSVLKGKRAQARTAIVELMQQQERYMTQTNQYLAFTNAAGTVTPSSAATTFKVYSGDNPTTPPYWLSASVCPGQLINVCVLITATPTSADPLVGNLTMDSTGAKDCSGTAHGANSPLCWP